MLSQLLSPGQHHPLHSLLAARLLENVEFMRVESRAPGIWGKTEGGAKPWRPAGNAGGRAGKHQERTGTSGRKPTGLGLHRKVEAVKDTIKQDV